MVDLFTNWMPRAVTSVIDGIWQSAFAIGWAILCFYMVHGLIEMRDYGDRSMLMQLPLWWAYVPSVLGAGAASAIAFAQAIAPGKFDALGG
jgi:TRAP-type C4-dicarboxylate transport system permease small subunit